MGRIPWNLADHRISRPWRSDIGLKRNPEGTLALLRVDRHRPSGAAGFTLYHPAVQGQRAAKPRDDHCHGIGRRHRELGSFFTRGHVDSGGPGIGQGPAERPAGRHAGAGRIAGTLARAEQRKNDDDVTGTRHGRESYLWRQAVVKLKVGFMAGHSKWKQIKRKKAVTDQKRGAMFTRLIREITIAAKQGGGDPGGNPRLRTAIDAAKAENMPWDNIDRAIKKGTGELEGVTYEEVTYEGYGPGGAALLIQATTDNANRTVAEIRNVFSKHGGNLGASNAVAWMFDRRGQIVVDGKANEDATMEVALDVGADDMQREGDIYVITTPPAQLHAVDQALRARKLPVQSAELSMVPKNTVRVEGSDAKRLLQLVESLEEMDDVAKVFSNFDIDAEAMAAVTG